MWLVLAAAVAVTANCGANPAVLESGKGSPVPTAAAKVDTFDSDLADVKRADFTWIYVIRRRDGGVLDTADKAKVRNATGQANRRVVSDEGRAIIVGSNFREGNAGIETLKKDLDVTDLSPPPSPASPAADSNANAQQ